MNLNLNVKRVESEGLSSLAGNYFMPNLSIALHPSKSFGVIQSPLMRSSFVL
jgi:hypothetical protein